MAHFSIIQIIHCVLPLLVYGLRLINLWSFFKADLSPRCIKRGLCLRMNPRRTLTLSHFKLKGGKVKVQGIHALVQDYSFFFFLIYGKHIGLLTQAFSDGPSYSLIVKQDHIFFKGK